MFEGTRSLRNAYSKTQAMPCANRQFVPNHDWHIIYAAASSSRSNSFTASLSFSGSRPIRAGTKGSGLRGATGGI
jgi:hypothetical protein